MFDREEHKNAQILSIPCLGIAKTVKLPAALGSIANADGRIMVLPNILLLLNQVRQPNHVLYSTAADNKVNLMRL